jgi:hypothetical protein
VMRWYESWIRNNPPVTLINISSIVLKRNRLFILEV